MKKNLLQRLLPPPGASAFGGIGTFQGIPEETLKQIFQVAHFDYMGATEYEGGKIPASLQYMNKNKDSLELFEHVIKGTTFIFLISKEKAETYSKKVESWAEDNHDAHDEYHGLCDIINKKEYNRSKKIVGWLDIDEHVMFFRDIEEGKIMARQFYFGLKPEAIEE